MALAGTLEPDRRMVSRIRLTSMAPRPLLGSLLVPWGLGVLNVKRAFRVNVWLETYASSSYNVAVLWASSQDFLCNPGGAVRPRARRTFGRCPFRRAGPT